MSVLRRSLLDLTGVYDTGVPGWTQPDPVLVPPGADQYSWKAASVSTNYNGATITAELQGTVDGSESSLPTDSDDWVALGQAVFTADGHEYVTVDGGNLISVQGYRFIRVFHTVTGGPPTANVTVTSRLTGDYVD